MPVPTSNQGAESKRWLVPLLANLETRRVVGDPAAVADRLGVPLWHELGYGAGADGPFRRRLPIASLVPASKRPGAVARATEPAPAAPPTTLLALLAILETQRVVGLSVVETVRHGLPRLHNCRARGCPAC